MERERKGLEWKEWFSLAEEFYQTHHHLRVNRNYITPNGKKLGRWIERQRAAFKGLGTCVMTIEKAAALERIGMDWLAKEECSWDLFYLQAEEYYHLFHHLRIPFNYCTNEGLQLGKWINQQRNKYKLKQLSWQQVERLNAIGMHWAMIKHPTDEQWMQMAKQYFLEYGNVHVPPHYVTEDGYALGAWINKVKTKYLSD